ncbi:hypothetical protein CHARACLAT_025956 [Characodon lateralis]|uniref:SEA domain-containing protein n=1 Tax=Characodon lateralis TaxID=208331 RepID=A0ABU7DK98_9TELE|nr:hypothetical protein [Characodon lateralis]
MLTEAEMDKFSLSIPCTGFGGALRIIVTPRVYYRALVNFTNSVVYGPELEDIFSPEFKEISEAVMDTLESEYNKIPGAQTVNVVLIKKMIREAGVDIFVELDVGSDYNNEEQIRRVLYNVVKEGTIASYVTSVQGFQFRQLGKVITLPSVDPIAVPGLYCTMPPAW